MNIPSSGGHRALQSVVLSKTETFTVERPTYTSGAMGGNESASEHDVDMWVGSPQEIAEDTDYGERLTGSLAGLASPSADIEEGDRFTYQSVPYEVAETIVSDSDVGDTLKIINFVRRQE